jgi:hypothetical protein
LVGFVHDIIYLNSFSRGQKHWIPGAFAASLQQGRFYSKQDIHSKAASIRATLDCVAQVFKLADRPDPRMDSDAKVVFILQMQLWSYTNLDNPEVRQATVTAYILHQFIKLAISPADQAMGKLFTWVFSPLCNLVNTLRYLVLEKPKSSHYVIYDSLLGTGISGTPFLTSI